MKKNIINNHNTTTPAFQQALVEIQKIKELAAEEAKRALIEELTPAIKKEIERGMQEGSILLFEEDMMNLDSTPLPGAENIEGGTPPPTDGLGGPGMETGMDLPAPVSTGPVQPLGAGISGVPMPDQDGKVVVNLSQLWNSAPVGIPAAPITLPPAPAPMDMGAPPLPPTPSPATDSSGTPPPPVVGNEMQTPPAMPEDPTQQQPQQQDGLPLPESVRVFGKNLKVLEQRVKTLTTPLHFEAAQTLVLELFENLQEIKESKQAPKLFIKEKEGKLASLFTTIKETQKKHSSYSQKDDTKVQEDMKKDLGAFARALFLEEAEAAKGSSGFGDKKGSSKGSHEGFGDGAKGGKGSAGFGDSSEKPKEKVGEKSKASEEAAGTHAKKASESRPVADPGKKESLKVEALTEAEELEMEAIEAELKELFGEMDDDASGDDTSSGDADMVEVKKESLNVRLKALKEEEARLTAALKECDMDGLVGGAGGSGTVTLHADTVNINVASPSDVQGSAMQGGMDLPDTAAVDSEPSVIDGDDSGEDTDELSDIEIVDDEEPEMGDDSDDDGDEEKPSGLEESTANKKGKKVVSLVKENKDLKTNLNEMEVLVARSLYLNKFLCRDDLSGAQKRKIVEFLDTARTVKEAKDVYLKVKKVLDEATTKKVQPVRKNVGSGSAVVSESAKATNRKEVLSESVDNDDTSVATPDRWQKLAGITKKD